MDALTILLIAEKVETITNGLNSAIGGVIAVGLFILVVVTCIAAQGWSIVKRLHIFDEKDNRK